MNLKKLSVLFFMLFAFSLVTLAQKDEEEAQMFGSKRSLPLHDFGKIASDAKVEYQFEKLNSSRADLSVGDVSLPEGVGVMFLKKVAKTDEKVSLVFIVNAAAMGKGAFSKDVTVTYVTKNSDGISKKDDVTYTLVGIVK